MKHVTILNLTKAEKSPLRVAYCDTFACRLRGFTFRRILDIQDGLLLVQNRDSRMDAAIHMLGVFFDLGIIWINTAGEVVDTCLARRWRPAYVPKKPARYILEIHPERLSEFTVGDQVRFENVQVA